MALDIDVIGASGAEGGGGGGSSYTGGNSGSVDWIGGMLQNWQSSSYARSSQKRQMNFQHDMSSTAHQREVADLRAAGLNPILSATGGAGAPMGAGSAPTVQMSNVVSSALEAANLRATNQNIEADTRQKKSNAELNTQLWNQSKALEDNLKAENPGIKSTSEIMTSNAKGRQLEGQIDETKYGEALRYLDRLMRSLTGGSSAIRNVK